MNSAEECSIVSTFIYHKLNKLFCISFYRSSLIFLFCFLKHILKKFWYIIEDYTKSWFRLNCWTDVFHFLLLRSVSWIIYLVLHKHLNFIWTITHKFFINLDDYVLIFLLNNVFVSLVVISYFITPHSKSKWFGHFSTGIHNFQILCLLEELRQSWKWTFNFIEEFK